MIPREILRSASAAAVTVKMERDLHNWIRARGLQVHFLNRTELFTFKRCVNGQMNETGNRI